MYKRTTTLLTLLLLTIGAQAQRVSIWLPHFAGKEYVFVLNQGLTGDTIARGTLNAQGQTSIALPDRYREYRGMSRFRLAEGGGLDLVVAGGENYMVSCMDAVPSVDNIVVTDSPENSFVTREFREEQRLRQQAQVLETVLQAFDKADGFYKQALEKQAAIERATARHDSLVAHTPLYAGRFLQLSRYLDDVATAYTKRGDDLERIRAYGLRQLDLEAMYTSGLWYHIVDYWTAMYRDYINEDDALRKDAISILKRTPKREVFEEFAANILSICEQNNWGETQAALADYLASSRRIDGDSKLSLRDVVMMNRVAPGRMAPDLVLANGKKLSLANRGNTKTLLVFHETGCDNCDREIGLLRQQYAALREEGVEVISVSSDLDKGIFEAVAPSFPWERRICDYRGFEGANFRNYVVMGTPTLFVVDGKGVILGRYARLEEVEN